MSRVDGRNVDELRAITLIYERLRRVDGSARFGFGETQALASVSGPIEVRLNLESPSHATLEVHIRPLASVPATDSRALASILKTVLSPSLLLSQHPRTLVQLVCQALCGSDSGSGTGAVGRGWTASLMASLINASSAAFINASSVPMDGIVCAVAVGRLPNKTKGPCSLILDPSETELPQLTGGGCFAFLFSSTVSRDAIQAEIPNALLLWRNYAAMGDTFDEAEFSRAQNLAMQGAKEVWLKLKESIHKGAAASLAQHHEETAQSTSVVSHSESDDNNMEK